MSTIDFTPTAYTVRSPGNGQPVRYEGEGWKWDIERAKSIYEEFATDYPALAALVVPDHFVQEYCRDYDRNLWSGGRGFGVHGDRPFFELAEKGLGEARFS